MKQLDSFLGNDFVDKKTDGDSFVRKHIIVYRYSSFLFGVSIMIYLVITAFLTAR